jgi:hypothetical protein
MALNMPAILKLWAITALGTFWHIIHVPIILQAIYYVQLLLR